MRLAITIAAAIALLPATSASSEPSPEVLDAVAPLATFMVDARECGFEIADTQTEDWLTRAGLPQTDEVAEALFGTLMLKAMDAQEDKAKYSEAFCATLAESLQAEELLSK